MYTFEQYSEETYKTATSYLSVQELRDIVQYNPFISYPGLDTDPETDIEINLINAAMLLDQFYIWNGIKQKEDQNLYFPRLYEEEYKLSDEIKLAHAYIAGILKDGGSETLIIPNNDGKFVKKEKVDVLEVEYSEGIEKKDNAFINHPYLEKLLAKYMEYGMISIAKVKRG